MNNDDLEPLHTTKFVYSLDEFKKSALVLTPIKEHIKNRLIPAHCFSVGIGLIIGALRRQPVSGIQFALISFPLFVMLCHLTTPHQLSRKALKHYNAQGIKGLISNYAFGEDSVEVCSIIPEGSKGKEVCSKIKYENFKKIIEIETNFYLLTGVDGEEGVFSLTKENCSPELREFLRNLPAEHKYLKNSIFWK